LCNGPYKLESWSADGRLVVVRNPGYPGLRLGNVARIEFSYTTDAAERLRLFMADELDTCWVYSDYERLFAPVPADRWLIKPYQTSMYLVLIPVFAPLNDRRVRQALTQATRRPALAASPPLRTSEAARGGLIPVGMPGHSPELSAPYDLEHARQLLQAAGYAHGADLPPLRMVASSLSLQRVGQGIAQQWQQTLGVQCQVDLVTLGDIVEQIESGAFHLYLLSWIADFSDPHNFMVQAIPSSQLFPEPTYWQAAAEAARTLDVRERMARYHELDRRLLVEEAIIIPISYNRYAVVKQPRVLDYPMLPVTYFPYKNVTLADE
jgi:ABC-type transport system substrate-binding protein